MKLVMLLGMIYLLLAGGEVQAQEKETFVLIKTTVGTMKAKLYHDTPVHRDHFIRLAKAGHYNGTLFYRVMKDFMIQGGSSDSRNASPGQELGYGEEVAIKAEILPTHYHKKGALAAPRQPDAVNPRKQSDISQFYIVHGRTYLPEELQAIENKVNKPLKKAIQEKYYTKEKKVILDSLRKLKKVAEFRAIAGEIKEQINREWMACTGKLEIPEAKKRDYTTVGGVYHLDNEYTVFGEIVEGLEVIDKIALMKTDKNNRPLTDVKIIMVSILE